MFKIAKEILFIAFAICILNVIMLIGFSIAGYTVPMDKIITTLEWEGGAVSVYLFWRIVIG